jgi:hypothetical protein
MSAASRFIDVATIEEDVMKRIAISVFAVLVVCAVPFLVAHPLEAAPRPDNVVVVNDAANPVPVALGGTVTTAPANNPTPVSRIGILSATTGREAREAIYTVPAGKRLYIQTETALTNCAGGVKPQVTVVAWNVSGGGLFYAMVPQTDRGWWDGQGQSFEGTIAAPMFADAGQIVEARVWLNTDVPPGGGFRAEIGFSGYLVDLP